MSKKLTITDILAQKDALKNKTLKRQTLYVPSMGAELIVEEPPRSLLVELQDVEDGKSNDYLIYQCTVDPNLRENHQQLMDAFECAEPHDVVQYLFTVQEISDIAVAILKLAGISQEGSGVRAVDAVKN